jgi:CRP-like cAMP-binding protein
MSNPSPHTLDPLLTKLQTRGTFLPAEQAAVLALPFFERTIEAGHYVVREGDEPQRSCLLLSGLAYRQKLSGSGGRQIMSIHMRGDLIDLQNSLLGRADHNVQMLTSGSLALIPVDAIRTVAFAFPAVGMAMWHETLVDGSIFREWILNVGRRDARTRIAHLLCEFAVRMEAADLGGQTGYELPMTQEQIADATGLTAVHVNRMLQGLTRDGLITRTKRKVAIEDWQKLARVGDFNDGYLHLGPAPGAGQLTGS